MNRGGVDGLMQSAGDANRRILLRGATVVTMDPEIGDLAVGDVLIEGTKIIDVAPDLASAAADNQAVDVDLTGAIVIPGMHDTHRHAWQGQFRRMLPDADVAQYGQVMHRLLGPLYRAEDMYAGNLISALGAINCGITTVLDFSHNSRTPEHADASVDAWSDARMRAVYAPCGPLFGDWDHHWPADVDRLRQERFASEDQLLSLRLGVLSQAAAQAIPGADEGGMLSEQTLTFARERGLKVSVDGVSGPVASEHLVRLGAGVLGDDTTYIHCRDLSDHAWQAIVDSGGSVSLAPTSGAQFGRPNSVTPVQKVLDQGLRPALSLDVECCLTTDMFTQMRFVLNLQRTAASNGPPVEGTTAPSAISARDVLEFATVQGARANGLLAKCGTLKPGKDADLVVLRADTINTLPLNNAIGTVVLGSDTKDVDGVLIAGQVRKWNGELVGQDLTKVRRLVTESRDRLVSISGYDLDVLR